MKRLSLRLQVFLSIVGASLATTVIAGLFARTALSTAFDAYLGSMATDATQGMGRGRGMGRMLLGSAEQVFVSSVDRGIYLAAVFAVAVGVIVAILLAAYLARPLRRLETAAEEIASGDLSHRVAAEGPAEVVALGEAFNTMADSLETAEELRRRLVADVAHELRNPLAAARAQAEGMLDGVVAVEPRRLESLVEDLKHLSALIDDLQELAVADAGRMRYDMRGFDIAALVRSEAERAQSLLAEGVSLVIEVGPEPVSVVGDERRLAQVLRNLLTNAARHTAHGSVTVSVEAAGGDVATRVIDTGEGVSPDDIEHVFERFYRADAARAADTGGAGLGLAISRAIVRDHGGDMFARSADGSTEFGFRIPAGA